MHNRHFDRYAPRRRNESWATARRGFDDRLNRIRRIGAFDRHRVLDQIESTFDFLALVAASHLNEAGDFSLESIQLHIRDRRALNTPDQRENISVAPARRHDRQLPRPRRK